MGRAEIIIVDYGVGNLFNLQRAFKAIGVSALISNDVKYIENAPRLILPGVGAFYEGMKQLHEHGLVSVLKAYAKSGKPMLGICLGMQLLMSSSEEDGEHQGLDILSGRVVSFKKNQKHRYKIPHIGWNSVQVDPYKSNSEYYYFNHSYIVCPENKEYIIGQTHYGEDLFCSQVKKDNVVGFQFHPELSGEVGLNLLRLFLKAEGKRYVI